MKVISISAAAKSTISTGRRQGAIAAPSAPTETHSLLASQSVSPDLPRVPWSDASAPASIAASSVVGYARAARKESEYTTVSS